MNSSQIIQICVTNRSTSESMDTIYSKRLELEDLLSIIDETTDKCFTKIAIIGDRPDRNHLY